MTYAQIKSGQRLHLVYEAGEGNPVVRRGFVSNPLCGAHVENGYRMTINLPLANACKNCVRVFMRRGGTQ